MADEPPAANSLRPAGRERSVRRGDTPDHLQRRYFVDDRGGAGLGFYADAQVKTPAFRDTGGRLTAQRSDPHAIRDMTAIAQHRGWRIVVAQGSASFRREAWLQGRAAGLEVRGYRPTVRDLQDLGRRLDRAQGRRPSPEPARSSFPHDPGAQDRLRIVEAVVRSRLPDVEAQERILARTRDKVADLITRGARFVPLHRARDLPRPMHERSR